jgi:hypothetical protein
MHAKLTEHCLWGPPCRTVRETRNQGCMWDCSGCLSCSRPPAHAPRCSLGSPACYASHAACRPSLRVGAVSNTTSSVLERITTCRVRLWRCLLRSAWRVMSIITCRGGSSCEGVVPAVRSSAFTHSRPHEGRFLVLGEPHLPTTFLHENRQAKHQSN